MSQSPLPYPPSPWQPPRPIEAPQRRRAARRSPIVHILLFVATFFTTSLTGAFALGVNPLVDPWSLRAGFSYSTTLMIIMLFHEFGHYFLAVFHRVGTTLPFFLPGPPLPPPFLAPGTFGAFIRIRELLPSRRALFDIGAAGPWAGLLIAAPAFYIGLRLSDVRPQVLAPAGGVLGESLMMKGLTWLALGTTGDNVTITLHPIGVAGWWGLVITMLNLMPIGQLDGGHVVYAMFGRRHRWIARGAVFLVAALAVFSSGTWAVWVLIAMIIGVDHPPTVEDFVPLQGWRRLGGWLTILMFFLVFMPGLAHDSAQPDEPDAQRVEVRAESPDGGWPATMWRQTTWSEPLLSRVGGWKR